MEDHALELKLQELEALDKAHHDASSLVSLAQDIERATSTANKGQKISSSNDVRRAALRLWNLAVERGRTAADASNAQRSFTSLHLCVFIVCV